MLIVSLMAFIVDIQLNCGIPDGATCAIMGITCDPVSSVEMDGFKIVSFQHPIEM